MSLRTNGMSRGCRQTSRATSSESSIWTPLPLCRVFPRSEYSCLRQANQRNYELRASKPETDFSYPLGGIKIEANSFRIIHSSRFFVSKFVRFLSTMNSIRSHFEQNFAVFGVSISGRTKPRAPIAGGNARG